MNRRNFALISAGLALSAGMLIAPGGQARNSVPAGGAINVEVAPDPSTVVCEVKLPAGLRFVSFRNVYGAAADLASRVHDLEARNLAGSAIRVNRVSNDRFEFSESAAFVRYKIDAKPLTPATNNIYASWVSASNGILMLGDLAPIEFRDLRGIEASFRAPPGWKIASSALAITEQGSSTSSGFRFQIRDVATAAFAIGTDLTENVGKFSGINTRVVTSGNWAFSEKEALDLIGSILTEHVRSMNRESVPACAVFVLPYPVPQPAQRWSAETRGNTVMHLSGSQPSKIVALSQLGLVMTHELMHLWVPNAVNLEGNYDWFYEGFTLYQALRAGMEIGTFTFQDYLNAIGKAADAYESDPRRDSMSLVELSAHRWTGAESVIYNKGMLAAFLYDLRLRNETGNKRSLSDVYRELTKLHTPDSLRVEGNPAVLQLLASEKNMAPFVEKTIRSVSPLEVQREFAEYGLSVVKGPVRTHANVAPNPGGRQKAVLKELGYNNEARH